MRLCKYSYVLIVILFSNTALLAQSNEKLYFNKELTVTADNDLFAFAGTDRYYTQGLFLKYSTVSKKAKVGIVKQINEWEAGQMIFTAYQREVHVIKELDRPAAGYLFLKYSKTNFTNNNKLFSYGVSGGTTGKSSLARQLINGYHPLVNVNSNWWGWVWDYQVKDEIGINAKGQYAFATLNKKENNHFQITPITNITLGTSFTNVSQSVLFQVGKYNKMYESGYWNAKIGNSFSATSKNELFLFYEPKILYQAYDATIQGGMFRSDKGRVVWPVKPLVFTSHVGLFFSNKRYSLSFHEYYQTRQAKYQFNNHAYGRIEVGYRFR